MINDQIGVAVAALAAVLGETDPKAIGRLRQVIERDGLDHARQLAHVAVRTDGAARTPGGVFLAAAKLARRARREGRQAAEVATAPPAPPPPPPPAPPASPASPPPPRRAAPKTRRRQIGAVVVEYRRPKGQQS